MLEMLLQWCNVSWKLIKYYIVSKKVWTYNNTDNIKHDDMQQILRQHF